MEAFLVVRESGNCSWWQAAEFFAAWKGTLCAANFNVAIIFALVADC